MTTDIRLEDTRVVVVGELYAADDVVVPVRVARSTTSVVSGLLATALSETGIQRIAVGDEIERLRATLADLGAQLADTRIAATIRAEAEHYTQDHWRWCARCSILHFALNAARSTCRHDGKPHSTDSGWYRLYPHRSRHAGHAGWKWCRRCQGLFNADAGGSGVCVDGDVHDDSGSPSYVLATAAHGVPGQDGWHHCNECYLLFHGDNVGVCNGGGTHSATGSRNYFIAFQ
jgi:hypothetical protein